MNIPRTHVDWKHYEPGKAECRSDEGDALSIGETPNNFAQKKLRPYCNACRAADVLLDGDTDRAASNGDLPAISPTVYPSHPEHTHGIPVSPRLTADTPLPTTKHRVVIAVDLLDTWQRYAAAHHPEIKAALDLALRTCLARVGAEVHGA
jgi:hypothetical protein